jgi:hypothetical protein
MKKAGENYALGATKSKEVIFCQIDVIGKVRSGKIMQYNPTTGKRIKHQSGAIDWFLNYYMDNENALKTIPTAHLTRVEDEPFFKFFETTTNNNGIPIKMFLEEESAMAWLEKHK